MLNLQLLKIHVISGLASQEVAVVASQAKAFPTTSVASIVVASQAEAFPTTSVASNVLSPAMGEESYN
jgi:hypothetical protein